MGALLDAGGSPWRIVLPSSATSADRSCAHGTVRDRSFAIQYEYWKYYDKKNRITPRASRQVAPILRVGKPP